MKKLSRLLAVLLAAALLLSCSMAMAEDYSAPKKAADIAGLPDMPSVPTMKTKNDGVTETITLSEEVEWISAVWNWESVSIEMDGTTGTYDIAGNNKKYKCQQGMGTKVTFIDAPWMWVDGDGLEYDSFIELETTDPDALKAWKAEALAWLDANDPGIKYSWVKYDHEVDRHSKGYKVIEFTPADAEAKKIFGKDCVGTWAAYWTCDKWAEVFGTYELTAYQGYGDNQNGHGFVGAEFAFDGMTKDGVSVKYDRAGRNTARSITAEDANVFGTETAPASTEFVWIRFVNSDGSVSYHLHTVIATYEEGDYATIQAWYSAGGDLRQVHATPAE